MRFTQRLILLLMLLWLPLQAVASVAMPLCRSERAGAAHTHKMQAGHQHQHHMQAQTGMHADQAAQADRYTDCDDCSFCHLACAGVIPVAATQLGLAATASVKIAAPASAFAEGILSPLHRPPIAAA